MSNGIIAELGPKPICVSIIVPAHNECASLEELVRRLHCVLTRNTASHEIVIIDDGSTDGSSVALSRLTSTFSTLAVIPHQRRLGQSAGIQSGVNHCSGAYVVIMDADLQDRPEDIPALLAELKAGFNFVATRRRRKSDGLARRIASAAANYLLQVLAGSMVEDAGGMCAMRGDIARGLQLRKGDHRFLPLIADHRGLIAQIDVERDPRRTGRSHYGFSRIIPVADFILKSIWNRHRRSRQSHGGTWSLVLLAVVLAASAYLNIWNNDFPTWLHADEQKKVRFVLESRQDFLHPILLLQLTRLASRVAGLDCAGDIARMGRTVSALAHVATVAGIYRLLTGVVPPPFALLGSVFATVCPILVIHSHYFKEDMVFAACMVWTLILYRRFLGKPNVRSAGFFGLAAGLTASSHYKSALALLLLAVYPLLRRHSLFAMAGKPRLRHFYAFSLISLFIAADAFCIINYPLLNNPSVFFRGVHFEGTHLIEGHVGVRIFPGPQWYLYHWRYSLVPGMTLAISFCGLVSLICSLLRWNLQTDTERLLALFSIGYYLIAESSPSKPPPDDCRYMIPVAIPLICFAAIGIEGVWTSLRRYRVACVLIVSTSVVLAASDTVLLVNFLKDDTRLRVADFVESDPVRTRIAFAKYTGNQDWQNPNIEDFKHGFTDYVIVSSFDYQRYQFAEDLEGQSEEVYRIASEYRHLFTFPYLEIQPQYRSYAFSNPIVRIVDLRKAKNEFVDGRSFIVNEPD